MVAVVKGGAPCKNGESNYSREIDITREMLRICMFIAITADHDKCLSNYIFPGALSGESEVYLGDLDYSMR